ncbi:hypothetical protein RRH01S_23_00090 [Rhizobium rhizogenes NBRC 13257]|uniref:Uncharacterized protein n=1 Tax=Rhizobium rhizogenes NBRC 13257 TaxID=1220581 RepID=A0AA87QKT6_RHIRH|nr:hypothetical protein RRH01S_23_00090 [Rhizobium rhizogenes NBRC 13257]
MSVQLLDPAAETEAVPSALDNGFFPVDTSRASAYEVHNPVTKRNARLWALGRSCDLAHRTQQKHVPIQWVAFLYQGNRHYQ